MKDKLSALASACIILQMAGCGERTEPAIPGEPASLRERALAAGLAPLPLDPPRPLENPYNEAKVELGHRLFFDPILSGPLDVACSTCHLPRFALADGRQFPSGAGASGLGPDRTDPTPAPLRLMPRNSPTVMNLGLLGRNSVEPSVKGTIFWSGSAFGLEDQALLPIVADNELRGLTYPKAVAVDSIVARLRTFPEYVQRFAEAYPEITLVHGAVPEAVITKTTLRRSLAAYIRELITPRAPLDDFLRGDDQALDAEQKAGLELFLGKAGCVACHHGPLLSDFKFYVLGVRQEGIGRDTTPGDDLGWGEHGGVPYAFRTAPLRQVELTSPYFHAGTAETLLDVLAFKNAGRSENLRVAAADLSPLMRPLGLSAAELNAIAAFLRALTDNDTPKESRFLAPARVPSGLEIPQ